MLCLSRCLICTQKDGQTPAVQNRKIFFPGRLREPKHIIAGYNVAYHLRLNFTDASITQTRDSFDDRLLNDSLAVQLLHVAISYK